MKIQIHANNGSVGLIGDLLDDMWFTAIAWSERIYRIKKHCIFFLIISMMDFMYQNKIMYPTLFHTTCIAFCKIEAIFIECIIYMVAVEFE